MKKKSKTTSRNQIVYSDAPGVKALVRKYDALKDVDLVDAGVHEIVPEPASWLQVPAELVPEFEQKINRYLKRSKVSA